MQVSVKLVGVEQVQKRLDEIGRSIDPVLRKAVNRTATGTRQQKYVKPLQRLFVDRKALRRGFAIRPAGKRISNARIVPSSAGVPIPSWAGWNYSVVAPTRARIFVRSLQGRKLAAGFVNPASARKLALRTRGARASANKPRTALGPSLAYFFRQMTNDQLIRWVNAYLQQEFRKQIEAEVKTV